jgi:hypothetical protein
LLSENLAHCASYQWQTCFQSVIQDVALWLKAKETKKCRHRYDDDDDDLVDFCHL